MDEEHSHHDGLEQQRKALEQMSNDLTQRLQVMIEQQEQRAHEFNAIVSDYMPEQAIETPVENDSTLYESISVYDESEEYVEPPKPYYVPAPKVPRLKAKKKISDSPVQTLYEPEENEKEESSVSAVTIGIIIFAIFIILRSCN